MDQIKLNPTNTPIGQLPDNIQLAMMGTTFAEFRAAVTQRLGLGEHPQGLSSRAYAEIVRPAHHRLPPLFRHMPAGDLRALADYRRVELLADAARGILLQIAERGLHRHAALQDIYRHGLDDLCNAQLNRERRQQHLNDLRLRRVRSVIPDAWCARVKVRWCDTAASAKLWYEQMVEWDRPYRAGRQNWPSRRYDVLWVYVQRGTVPTVSADGREITVGPWTYRRGRGHQLSVQYHPLSDAADNRAAFVAEHNTERRCAILNACGEDLSSIARMEELQRDDFGQLYAVDGCGRFVRVVCPTTDRVYWLQVPDRCETAHAAVAATFGLTAREYTPMVQA